MEKSTEVVEMSPKSDSFKILTEQDMASEQDASSSEVRSLISSSGNALSSIKEGDTDRELVSWQGVYYPPTSTYGYFYQGYDGSYPKQDNLGHFIPLGGLGVPYPGIQVENSSLVYYMPSYNPYSLGSLMATDGLCVGQPPYFSMEYPQTNISYGSETVPIQSSNIKQFVENSPNGATVLGAHKPVASPSPTSSMKSKSSNSIGRNHFVDANLSKVSALPLDSKSCVTTASSNFPGQPLKPLIKAPQMKSGIQTSGAAKAFNPMGKFSSLANQGQGQLSPRNSMTNFKSKGQTWTDNDGYNIINRSRDFEASSDLPCNQGQGRFFPRNSMTNFKANSQTWTDTDRYKIINRSRDFESSSDLPRGPRANRGKLSLTSSDEKDSLKFLMRRDTYNQPDFQIQYKEAKFYMIKSYSEDDIHKSIKYNVWASTPTGNKKLDVAFREAETRAKEVVKCPIFLFFSVNASGQFVGLAEMTGPVDFNKSMDFWQQDKWNGFFPVKWHIIKDIPNGLFRNITLENNDNRAVTYSRDTQEIRLPQGLKMLHIFKNYLVETSILDDFGFYEGREKSLHARRSTALAHPEVANNSNNSFMKHSEASRKVELSTNSKRTTNDPKTSLITLTKNLSLNARSAP